MITRSVYVNKLKVNLSDIIYFLFLGIPVDSLVVSVRYKDEYKGEFIKPFSTALSVNFMDGDIKRKTKVYNSGIIQYCNISSDDEAIHVANILCTILNTSIKTMNNIQSEDIQNLRGDIEKFNRIQQYKSSYYGKVDICEEYEDYSIVPSKHILVEDLVLQNRPYSYLQRRINAMKAYQEYTETISLDYIKNVWSKIEYSYPSKIIIQKLHGILLGSYRMHSCSNTSWLIIYHNECSTLSHGKENKKDQKTKISACGKILHDGNNLPFLIEKHQELLNIIQKHSNDICF